MNPRLVAEGAEPRHRVIRELCECLAAEARSASAEKDNVAGRGKFFHRLPERRKIVGLFRQARVGLDGSTFTMLKFRSMHVDAEQRLAELRGSNPHIYCKFGDPGCDS